MKTAKLTYLKIAEFLQSLTDIEVNIYHDIIANEGAKIIDEYTENKVAEFIKWLDKEDYNLLRWRNNNEQLYQKFKEGQK